MSGAKGLLVDVSVDVAEVIDGEDDIAEVVDIINDTDDEAACLAVRLGSPPIRFRGYRRGRELGRGATGKVFLCHRKGCGTGFAVKAVDLRRIQLSSNAEREHTALCREVEILKTLPPHPNIVQMIDAFEEGDWFLIVLELVGGGDLYTVLTAREQPRLLEREAAFVLRQLACGLTFLHGQGVIHRDLKLENVLIASECRARAMVLYSVKITDFGLSKAIGGGVSEAYSLVGTRPYTAPEVFSGGSYDFSSDLWCLGVVLYILLAGRFPFNDIPDQQADLDGLIDVVDASETARSVVLGLLQIEPSQRSSLEALGSHEWLQDDVAAERPERELKRRRTREGPGAPAAASPYAGGPETEAAPDGTPDDLSPAPRGADASPGPGTQAGEPSTPAAAEGVAEGAPDAPAASKSVGSEVVVEAADVWPRSNRPDVMQLHFVMPDRHSEAVHGRAGVHMRQVASAVGCKMWVGPCDSVGARRVVVSGTYTQCAIVQELLRSRLAEASRAEGEDLTDHTDVLLFVRVEAAGVVTGKRQFKLRQIRQESGASVQLQPETVKGQRRCSVRGPFACVLRAERHIFDLVRAVPIVAKEGGPDLPRTRVGSEAVVGEVVCWKGHFGWIQPACAIDHPQAADHQGHIYVHQRDVSSGGPLKAGQRVGFHVYADFLGLGAEGCTLI